MEMESSRRSSIDRSRELPGLKKPRLSDDAQGRDRAANGGGVSSSRVSSANQPVNPRFRANEREREQREDSSKGGSSSSLKRQQELIAQYKAALAELTFNSKPIITNLTIIAGENFQAAKAIAATICNNVLEVPSEQKLPSLYLLDSIVKNIGRDYIKYFAARLPEVFCKAYKEADSSIHPGMRHLFGTWKGVFPPAALQLIEKELGLPPVVNGSSGTTSSKLNSQTQRPAHSIHVNPKYLEARKRLQQTRAKETKSDNSSEAIAPVEDAERSDRAATTGSTRQWIDQSEKIPNIQRPRRELPNDPRYGKKGLNFKDHQLSSVLPRQSEVAVGRIRERSEERDDIDKTYFGAGDLASEMARRRNGLDANRSYADYRTSGSVQADNRPPSSHISNTNKNVQAASRSWKNSEEEEYLWDDMDSKLTDYGGNNRSVKGGWSADTADKRGTLQRGQWLPLESEQTEIYQDRFDAFPRPKPSVGEDMVPLFKDFDDNHLQSHGQWDADTRRNLGTTVDMVPVGRSPSGQHTSSLWPQREPLLPVPGMNQPRFTCQSEDAPISLNPGSSTNFIPPISRPGLLSHSHSSNLGPTSIISERTFDQQLQQPLKPPSPSAHPPASFLPLQHQNFRGAIEHDHPQPPYSQLVQKPVQLPGHLIRNLRTPVAKDSSPALPQIQSQQSPSHNIYQPPSQSSQPLTPLTQLRHHPFLHRSPTEFPQAQTQSKPMIHSEQPQTSQGSGTPQSHGFLDDLPLTNSVDVSGKSSTSDLLAAIMKSGLLPNNPTSGLQNFNVHPPLPSGPPPIQALTSSAPMIIPSALSLQTSQSIVPALSESLTGLVSPPLPPGPPPSSSLASPSSQKSNADNAIANPFSSLLRSLVAKGMISSLSTETLLTSSAQLPPKVPDQIIEMSRSTPGQVSVISDTSSIPLSVKEPSAPTDIVAFTPNLTELKDLLGYDFRPEIIRELHPSVINSLFDDLNHQCDICGVRFRLQEQLHNHSDLHTSEKSKTNSSVEFSRRWYSNTSNWVAGNVEPTQAQVPATSLEEVARGGEDCEPMVPADESQSICALCGEPFEDFYSHDRDEWMYKGTMYLNSSGRMGDVQSMDELNEQVPIVHAKCVSTPPDNKDMTEKDKMDWTDG